MKHQRVAPVLQLPCATTLGIGAQSTCRPRCIIDRLGSAPFHADDVTGCTGSLEEHRHFTEVYYNAPTREIQIELTTVDREIEIGAEPPNFIKMDVEGHELSALRGAIFTLRTHRPTIIFEATDHLELIAELFKDCNYGIFDLAGQRLDKPVFYTVARPL